MRAFVALTQTLSATFSAGENRPPELFSLLRCIRGDTGSRKEGEREAVINSRKRDRTVSRKVAQHARHRSNCISPRFAAATKTVFSRGTSRRQRIKAQRFNYFLSRFRVRWKREEAVTKEDTGKCNENSYAAISGSIRVNSRFPF